MKKLNYWLDSKVNLTIKMLEFEGIYSFLLKKNAYREAIYQNEVFSD